MHSDPSILYPICMQNLNFTKPFFQCLVLAEELLLSLVQCHQEQGVCNLIFEQKLQYPYFQGTG